MGEDGASVPLGRLRQPEYTGDNRCWPCTIVNLLITLALVVVVAIVSPLAAAAVGLVGVVAIALRGYLVPGTPSLTKRYLPQRIRRMFGKDPAEMHAFPDDEDLEVALELRSMRADQSGDDEGP